MYAHTHTYIYINIFIYLFMYVHVWIYFFELAKLPSKKTRSPHFAFNSIILLNKYIYIYIYKYIYIYIYVCMYIYIYILICLFIYFFILTWFWTALNVLWINQSVIKSFLYIYHYYLCPLIRSFFDLVKNASYWKDIFVICDELLLHVQTINYEYIKTKKDVRFETNENRAFH